MASKTIVFTAKPQTDSMRLLFHIIPNDPDNPLTLAERVRIEFLVELESAGGDLVKISHTMTLAEVIASGFWPGTATQSQFLADLGAFRDFALNALAVTEADP